MVNDEGGSSVLAQVLSRAHSIELACLRDQLEAGTIVVSGEICGALFIGTALDRNMRRQPRNHLLVVSIEKDFCELGSRLKFDLPIHRLVCCQQ